MLVSALAKARALEAKAAEKSRLAEEAKRRAVEENRRKFPTAARLMEAFSMFSPVVIEARDGENYVLNSKIVKQNEVKVIPFTWTERWEREAASTVLERGAIRRMEWQI